MKDYQLFKSTYLTNQKANSNQLKANEQFDLHI